MITKVSNSNQLKILVCMVISALAYNANAGAGAEGSGVRGGGFIDYRTGTPRLLDLVTNAVCDFVTGQELLESLPTAKDTLTKLEGLDWYLGGDFKVKVANLDICFTGPLYRLDPSDPDSVIVQDHNDVRQGGIRIIGTNRVFVDRAQFDLLTESERSFFLLHEAGHGYFESITPMRNLRLHTLISKLHRLQIGQISRRSQLYGQLRGLDLNFPLSADYLDAARAQVLFLTADPDARESHIFLSSRPEELMVMPLDRLLPRLSTEHRNALMIELQGITLEGFFINHLSAAFIEATPEQFYDLLVVKRWNRINPVLIAMALFDQLSPRNKEILSEQPGFIEVATQGLRSIAGTRLKYLEYRIMAPTLIQRLASESPRPNGGLRPVTELRARVGQNVELPLELLASAQALARVAINQQWHTVAFLFTENADFYQALGLKTQIADVTGMNPVVQREKALALTVLSQLSMGLRSQFLDFTIRLVNDADPSGVTAAQLLQKINPQRFESLVEGL